MKIAPGAAAAILATEASWPLRFDRAWPLPLALACLMISLPWSILLCLTLTAFLPAYAADPRETNRPRTAAPNIVAIILDDAGFAATSTFGGLIATPALDRLANEGLRYNRFHVTAVCSPTRAALLTGRNHHRVGFGSIPEGAYGHHSYNNSWPKSATSIARVLQQNGYSTAAFGKWHNTPFAELTPIGPFDRWPTGLGFDHYYGFLVGETSQWEPLLWRDTTIIEPPRTAEQGYHLTTDLADEAVRWIQTQQSLAPEKPYFLYFATGAPHRPHHVPSEWIEPFKGKFDAGWDALRHQIFARQKQLGVIPADAKLTPRPHGLPAWNTLSRESRELAGGQIEAFAGFLAHTDHEVGRLLEAVRRGPRGENTVVFYIATDNGASGMDGVLGNDHAHAPPQPIDVQLQRAADAAGPDHFNAYAAGWAWMNSTPFSWMKLVASHLGGTRAPLVVTWPARIKNGGELRAQFTHVTDIAPTVYDIAGIPMPKAVDGVEQLPLDGVSFADSFHDALAVSRHSKQYFENWGSRAIYENGWIAAQRNIEPWSYQGLPAQDHPWELYQIERDFSQATDLATAHPGKLRTLQRLYEEEARVNGVLSSEALRELARGASTTAKKQTYFRFAHGMPMLPSVAAPNFAQPHRIVARLDVPDHDAQGVIVSNGSRLGGFTLYVKDGYLVYENNCRGLRRDILRAPRSLAPGKTEVAFELGGTRLPSGDFTGTGYLFVNGELVQEQRLPTVAPPHYGSGTFNIGRARVSPVSNAYALPFSYQGTISVEVFLTDARAEGG